MMFRIIHAAFKILPMCCALKKEVNPRTSSQSVDALSYQGSEAWSEFILERRERVMSQPRLGAPGHITPISSL